MRRLALAVLVALAFPASAFAHANLDSTSPTYRQRLQSPPRAVVLHFDQSVQTAPPPTEAYGSSGPTTTEHIVRWAYFPSLALLLGGLGFRLLLGREELPAAAERRFYAIVGAGAVATLEVGILAFILRAEDALQLPFVRL